MCTTCGCGQGEMMVAGEPLSGHAYISAARRVNPHIEILQVSATSGAGMADWLAGLKQGAQAAPVRD